MNNTTAPTAPTATDEHVAAVANYVDSDGIAYDDRGRAVIARVRRQLMSDTWGRGNQGDLGPAITHRDYAHFLEAVTRMASRDRGMAQAVTHIVRSVNLYGTRGQMANAVHAAVADLIRTGTWDDVIARTGPEPTRHSDAQRTWTLSDRLYFQYFIAEATATVADSVPSVGWCIDAIRRNEAPRCLAFSSFPSLKVAR